MRRRGRTSVHEKEKEKEKEDSKSTPAALELKVNKLLSSTT